MDVLPMFKSLLILIIHSSSLSHLKPRHVSRHWLFQLDRNSRTMWIADEFLIGNRHLHYNENVIFYQEVLFMLCNVQTTYCKRINS